MFRLAIVLALCYLLERAVAVVRWIEARVEDATDDDYPRRLR